jgi:hypothetical protein
LDIDVSEENAAFTFRIEMTRVRMLPDIPAEGHGK